MKSKPTLAPGVRPPPHTDAERIQLLRDWIGAAGHDGAASADFVLRLTLRDGSALKRHPSVRPHEITFASGVMHFLGVRVVEGGVADSMLDTGAAPPVA